MELPQDWGAGGRSPLARLVARSREAQAATQERCDLCGEAVPGEHRHLLEVETSQVMCACRACTILFDRGAASAGRLRLIPDRRLQLDGFALEEHEWAGLGIPVGLAFISCSTPAQAIVARYPAPLGPVESAVEPDSWRRIVQRNPTLEGLAPDVESLLINRARGARLCFIAPIDECYRLAGIVRTRWRGLSGGREVWMEVQGFFDSLVRRSKVADASGFRRATAALNGNGNGERA